MRRVKDRWEQRGKTARINSVASVERSPEKAGVGGSTPSLATMNPQTSSELTEHLQPKLLAQDNYCTVSVSKCALSPQEQLQELAWRFQARFQSGLWVKLQGRVHVFVDVIASGVRRGQIIQTVRRRQRLVLI